MIPTSGILKTLKLKIFSSDSGGGNGFCRDQDKGSGAVELQEKRPGKILQRLPNEQIGGEGEE